MAIIRTTLFTYKADIVKSVQLLSRALDNRGIEFRFSVGARDISSSTAFRSVLGPKRLLYNGKATGVAKLISHQAEQKLRMLEATRVLTLQAFMAYRVIKHKDNCTFYPT
jgi:hypothetical protein